MRHHVVLIAAVTLGSLVPASSAAATTQASADEYCMAIITTGQSWCADT